MSTYTDFAESMIIALYQESERTEKSYYNFGELIDRYGIESKESWIQRLADEWEYGYASDISRVLGGSARNWDVRISAHGMRYVEDKYGGKNGVGTILPPAEDAIAEPPTNDPEQSEGPAIQSSTWTGLRHDFVLTEEKRLALVRSLDVAEEGLPALQMGQEARAQARAYIMAARSLAEAPEPQPDLIWEIVNRANSIAGIASLFVAIMALFA